MLFLNLRQYIFIILMLQFPFASFGQERSNTQTKPKEQEQIASSRLDAVQLLDHARRLSDDARGLKPLDEIPLQARLADTVWPLDQSLAERLLGRSFELTVGLLKEPSDPASASTTADLQNIFALISVIAAKHDAKLEKKLKDRWQEATASLGEKADNKMTPNPTQQSYMLLTQSANYLKSDEQKARQLFRQSAALRVTQDHCFFLLNQRKRLPELADTWFSDTLEVLAQRPLSEANEIVMLSSYLFSPDGGIAYVVISGYNTANVAGNMSAIPQNPSLAKRYLGLLLAKVKANELIPPAVAYFALKNLLPQYQMFAPELLTDVYATTATLLPNVSKDDSATFADAHKDFNASESDRTADWTKRIENADKFDREERRDLEYFDILFGYLLPQKDFAKATLIVSRISNPELKENLGDLVNLAALQAKLEKADTASSVSESDSKKIKNPLVRVTALSSLGQARMKQKATADALRLFDQAVGEANQIKDDQDRIQAKLMLAQLSVVLDSSVGIERIAGAFKEINKFSDFNMNRSDLSLKVTVYGLKNELAIRSPAPSSLLSAVAIMCRVNCEETFQITRLLDKKEMRLWANFVAVRTGLSESSRQAGGSLR
jgi:hypothetical protein